MAACWLKMLIFFLGAWLRCSGSTVCSATTLKRLAAD
jgi:hypothetical protein